MVNDDAHFPGNTVNFNNESANNNTWDDVAHAGCIVGFGAFGLAIIIVTIMIALDMKKRMGMYEELIAEDLDKLQKLGMGSKMKEFERELAARLAGGKEEGGTDDQLITQALELRPDEFSRHLS